ncbi:hypothetical protein B0J12DRAFT_180081 [Macrophomina phaseolina]|uniref:Uncharacterized protein n=1 Tax=Macrophomina phaseolina TaxID=35725 RepID=A0ABQ8G493_9PEZI|nr:hypothetical protein B0J12DRAFT_180081 [Macrophomina phaseolina]
MCARNFIYRGVQRNARGSSTPWRACRSSLSAIGCSGWSGPSIPARRTKNRVTKDISETSATTLSSFSRNRPAGDALGASERDLGMPKDLGRWYLTDGLGFAKSTASGTSSGQLVHRTCQNPHPCPHPLPEDDICWSASSTFGPAICEMFNDVEYVIHALRCYRFLHSVLLTEAFNFDILKTCAHCAKRTSVTCSCWLPNTDFFFFLVSFHLVTLRSSNAEVGPDPAAPCLCRALLGDLAGYPARSCLRRDMRVASLGLAAALASCTP